jgi:hypothetical protein
MKPAWKNKTTLEGVVELAMNLGRRRLADYGATRSGQDFTQRQLMACLILRAYLKTICRGALEFLAVSPNLRQALGLADKLPHYPTLQKFSARSEILAITDAMIVTQKAIDDGLSAFRRKIFQDHLVRIQRAAQDNVKDPDDLKAIRHRLQEVEEILRTS